jgi:hypothetical protein
MDLTNRCHIYVMFMDVFMDSLHWQHLLAKPLATVTRNCTCLGQFGQHDGEGKYILRNFHERNHVRHCAKLCQCKLGFLIFGANKVEQ